MDFAQIAKMLRKAEPEEDSYESLRQMMSQNYSSGDTSSALEMAKNTPGKSFVYKNPNAPGAAPGRQFGIMADDLKKTPAGRSVVKAGPDGLDRVDTGRLTMQNTAAIGELANKIDSLFGNKNKFDGIGPSDPDENANWIEAEERRKHLDQQLESLANYYRTPKNEIPPAGGSTRFGGNAIDYRKG